MPERDKIEVEVNRLDRIENKLDKLSVAMVNLARAEEKIANVEAHISAQLERQNEFSKRLNVVEKSMTTHGADVKTIKKMFWAIFVVITLGGLATIGIQSTGFSINDKPSSSITQ